MRDWPSSDSGGKTKRRKGTNIKSTGILIAPPQRPIFFLPPQKNKTLARVHSERRMYQESGHFEFGTIDVDKQREELVSFFFVGWSAVGSL
ncbi:hypothetical protein D3C78_1294170 [compost metagenome]